MLNEKLKQDLIKYAIHNGITLAIGYIECLNSYKFMSSKKIGKDIYCLNIFISAYEPEWVYYVHLDDMIKSYDKYERENVIIDFRQALEALKNGKKVARKGWNDKDMFLYYVPEAHYNTCTDFVRKTFDMPVQHRAYIAIKTVHDNIVPWIPSQTDILADDWIVLN